MNSPSIDVKNTQEAPSWLANASGQTTSPIEPEAPALNNQDFTTTRQVSDLNADRKKQHRRYTLLLSKTI